MQTIVYQKFVSRYAEYFTLVEIWEGADSTAEVIPAARVAKMTEEEFEELLCELRESENEKASWGENDPYEEENARAGYHQQWDRINSDMDNSGINIY